MINGNIQIKRRKDFNNIQIKSCNPGQWMTKMRKNEINIDAIKADRFSFGAIVDFWLVHY